MSDDVRAPSWPPGYADPIQFRIRFPNRPRPRPVVPADLTSRPGTFHHPTDAEVAETMRRIGYAEPVKPVPARPKLESASETVPTGPKSGERPAPTEPLILRDETGRPVYDQQGSPMLFPAGLPPEFFVQEGLKDRRLLQMLAVQDGGQAILGYLIARLSLFRQHGPWDAQRGSRMNYVEFVDYATIAIGLYAVAAGIPINDILSIQNQYARLFSRYPNDTQFDREYSRLPSRNLRNTELGCSLFEHGVGRSKIGP